MKTGRNDLCPCGSGKKFKKCCEPNTAESSASPTTGPSPDTRPLLALFAAGRYAELESRTQPLIAQHPTLPTLWKLLGAAQLLQGKDAIAALARAVELVPQDPEAHTNLGNALRARGRAEEALEHHRCAIALKPTYAEAHNNLGGALRDLGRHEAAVESYRKAIAAKPEFAMAHNNLGVALQALGRADEAIASHRRALAHQPEFADAHSKLGNAFKSLSRSDEAMSSYRLALKLQPRNVEARLNLADLQLSQRRFDEAITGYRALLELAPGVAQIHNNLGNALRERGQAEDAVASYEQAIALQPDTAELHNNLGNALLDVGKIEAAADSYRRAISLRPDYARAHSNLGSALRELGRLEEATLSYHTALRLEPDSELILTSLGVVQRLLGETAQAEVTLDKARELNPESAAALSSLGDLKADLGQFEAAEELYRRAHAVQRNAAQAWAGIAALRKMTPDDHEWIEESERLESESIPARDAVQLQFAMGKYNDDVRDYNEAFLHYKRANDLAKTFSPTHDRENLSQTFDFVTGLYDREWLDKARAQSAAGVRPIFVVGMPRSGTSLAEQILASHPKIFGAGELSFWKTASLKVVSSAVEGKTGPAILAPLAAEYTQLLASLSGGASHVVDKMPGNFVHLGMIHAALPDARIIHMSRNPIDTCLSIYFHNFHIAYAYSNDLDDLAHYYAQYQRLMAHWRSILPADTFLDVPYELLVEDQETWSRRMVEFVGLPWDPACLEFHRTSRRVSTFSKWQVRQKIYKGSVERWRNYEPHLGPLLNLA